MSINIKTATDEQMTALWNEANAAGRQAAMENRPEMIQIAGRPDYEPFPICGFAWVNIKPGNCRFAKWLVSKGLASKDNYDGGVMVWISDYNQSYDRKLAHANAVANVFEANGLKVRAHGRLD